MKNNDFKYFLILKYIFKIYRNRNSNSKPQNIKIRPNLDEIKKKNKRL